MSNHFEIVEGYIDLLDGIYDLLQNHSKGLYEQEVYKQINHPRIEEVLNDLIESGILQENRKRDKVRIRVKTRAISIEPIEDGDGCSRCPVWADYMITTENGTYPYCVDCRHILFE